MKGKPIFKVVVGLYLVINTLIGIGDGEMSGLSGRMQSARYISFENNPIEFLIMTTVGLSIGIYLLISVKK